MVHRDLASKDEMFDEAVAAVNGQTERATSDWPLRYFDPDLANERVDVLFDGIRER